MTPSHHPDASTSSHDLREATYEDLQRACLQTELENRRLKSELARLTGERDEAQREREKWGEGFTKAIERALAAEAELANLKAAAARDVEERVRMREGLTAILPGRLIGEAHGAPDAERTAISVSFGALRTARAALNPEKTDV
jgi:predicted  nucleic acid-binding Zn-ribbon protein